MQIFHQCVNFGLWDLGVKPIVEVVDIWVKIFSEVGLLLDILLQVGLETSRKPLVFSLRALLVSWGENAGD